MNQLPSLQFSGLKVPVFYKAHMGSMKVSPPLMFDNTS